MQEHLIEAVTESTKTQTHHLPNVEVLYKRLATSTELIQI